MTWLRKAWEWLVAVAIAVPTIAALALWGAGWRRKALAERASKEAAWSAAAAATKREATEKRVREVQQRSLEALRHKIEGLRAGIAERERQIKALEGAAAVNDAFGLDDA